jgi:hypothetical protein
MRMDYRPSADAPGRVPAIAGSERVRLET